MTEKLTRTEFDVLARRVGIALTDAQANELTAVSGMIGAMTERNRNDRPRAIEPAHIFVPIEG